MARALLMAAWLGVALGCAEAPTLYVEAPLLVFESYPAHGATVARGDLGELAVIFTDDLGSPEEARAQAAFLSLADGQGRVAFVRPDRTNVAYEPDGHLLRVELDPEVQQGLRAGTWTFTVGRELTSADGRPLPHDYVVRFTLVDP